MKNQDLNTRRSLATPRGVGVMCDFYAVRAENATLWDANGKEYIDFAGGIAVLNTGHLHPKIKAAVSAQLDNFTHTAYQIVPYEGYVSLAERINRLAPIDGLKKSAFFTTGVEAVENAIKIARSATGRSGVIAFSGSFHGRTMLGMALTGKVAPYKLSFGPMPGDIYHVPFPNATQSITVADSLKGLDLLFKCDIDPKRVAAIILEPVQGEGGFNITPPELMTALRKICDEHGILLIADEVQTGFGRTGKLFAMEHHSVQADLITMAKSLGGGFPISGVVGRADVMDAPAAGGLGGTYAGNPLAVAAAHAVLDVIAEEKLCERAVTLGDKLRAHLEGLRAKVPGIADVRGLGSMVALELNDPATGKPDAEAVKRVQARAIEKGLILLSCGVYGNVLRFLYPLTIPDAQFDRALAILSEALAA
ncbi:MULTISPECIES: 4-aminobutyrate--2-oxoglutarate transaminase [Achromobacter]|uniref:4-aminobutyrate aminotransferase PuuE n=1 Tax=Achromobacter aegrifaciens TaxID=1287736 RepID=A0AAD2IYV2_ACHAE|nr:MULTISPECIES: 4-aminobutyrate--2-oxoglutarate transaminase [Achromobacter]MBD9423520.1 4-aminobutyrate--2-oxoglutarate transaminase [Achromobacter sp. ACM04]MBD9432918.1 4-aminobutyrate--2-oxoglutarate transaminase [Achromobacter sp. ACM03]MBD9476424.1 4-aminobutyrate--2-oxoglutarate transaminase [Achromobacter sp. ACM01]MDQ1761587.1 4-aminobutyrate--2-oxoglutarate transaminase [Achromobacter aegrifaciens]RSF01395.1 4-aminobutyrate--2-oxoglutarate transaminase [Achromobacter aegrifaciens]